MQHHDRIRPDLLGDVRWGPDRTLKPGPWVARLGNTVQASRDLITDPGGATGPDAARIIVERLMGKLRAYCLAHDVTIVAPITLTATDSHADAFTRNLVIILIEARGLNRRTPNPFPELVLFPRLERLLDVIRRLWGFVRSLRRFRRARAWRNLVVDARWRLWTAPRHRVARWRRRRRLDRRMRRAGLPIVRAEVATGRTMVHAGPDVKWHRLGIEQAPPLRSDALRTGELGSFGGFPIVTCPAIDPHRFYLVAPGQPCPGCGTVHR